MTLTQAPTLNQKLISIYRNETYADYDENTIVSLAFTYCTDEEIGKLARQSIALLFSHTQRQQTLAKQKIAFKTPEPKVDVFEQASGIKTSPKVEVDYTNTDAYHAISFYVNKAIKNAGESLVPIITKELCDSKVDAGNGITKRVGDMTYDDWNARTVLGIAMVLGHAQGVANELAYMRLIQENNVTCLDELVQ